MSLSETLLSRASDVAVHVVVGDGAVPPGSIASQQWEAVAGRHAPPGRRRDVAALSRSFAGVVLAVAAAVGVGMLATRFMALPMSRCCSSPPCWSVP